VASVVIVVDGVDTQPAQAEITSNATDSRARVKMRCNAHANFKAHDFPLFFWSYLKTTQAENYRWRVAHF
jgi:hypothetical protein